MTKRIIDILEVVEVKEHDRHPMSAALRQGEGMLDPVPKEVAIRKQRQRVVKGELA